MAVLSLESFPFKHICSLQQLFIFGKVWQTMGFGCLQFLNLDCSVGHCCWGRVLHCFLFFLYSVTAFKCQHHHGNPLPPPPSVTEHWELLWDVYLNVFMCLHVCLCQLSARAVCLALTSSGVEGLYSDPLVFHFPLHQSQCSQAPPGAKAPRPYNLLYERFSWCPAPQAQGDPLTLVL